MVDKNDTNAPQKTTGSLQGSRDGDHYVQDCCGCEGFCVYPQGKKATATVFLAICACVFSIAGVGSCNFLTIDGFSWGLLWRQEYDVDETLSDRRLQCTAWSEYEKNLMDGEYKTARAFGYFTIIILILAVPPVLALSCATIDSRSLKLLATCLLLATAFQVLVFVAFASELCESGARCTISFGGGLTVAGMLFCIMAAFSLLSMKPKSQMVYGEHEETHIVPEDQSDGGEVVPAAPAEKQDDSSTHVVDDEGAHESNDEFETPMQETREGTDDVEAGQDSQGVPRSEDTVAEGDESEEPQSAEEKKHWWSLTPTSANTT